MGTHAVKKMIGTDGAGKRLDKWLKIILPAFTRHDIKESIAVGLVLVNGRTVAPFAVLKSGDAVSGVVRTFGTLTLRGNPAVPFSVVHETKDFLVVDKPAGVAVTPDAKNQRTSLVNGLLSRYPQMRREFLGAAYLGVVQRLDKPASGLMVVAKTMPAFRTLMAAMREGKIFKQYRVRVEGNIELDNGTITVPLARQRKGKLLKVTPRRDGKPATTHYRVVARSNDFTDVDVRTESGRTHQIRVHFADIGHPVVGDRLYGKQRDGSSRLMLHASELTFPFGGKLHHFTLPLPEEFKKTNG
ncbi:MAG: RluA family pseudouridine synthase [Patescibacteria group bacterium]|nr:RluA family pseudouridine synthase [Patescibacteria group bacterium]